MPKWVRRIIFWTFVVVFLVIAPMLVLYTAGYRYNFSSGSVTRTGVLSITTNPRSVDIYLDGEYTQAKTPEVLKRIMPDGYSLELRKDGYHSWYGDVEIESGQTVQLQSILLFLDQDAELLFDKETDTMSVNPDGESIAYLTREGGWRETWLYEPAEDSHTLIQQTLDQNNEIELSWSAQGSYLLVFDATTDDTSIFDDQGQLLEIETQDVIKASWHPSTDHLMSLTTDDGLLQLDIETGDVETVALTDENSVLLDASILRLIQGTDYTEVAQYINDEKEILALLPKGTYTIEDRDGTYLILTDSLDRLYLIQIHEDEPILLKEDVVAYDWDAEQDRLVFTNGFELSTYNATSHTTELITRQSSMMEFVSWHPNSDIVFVQDDALRAFEIYTQAEQRNITTLLEDTDMQTLWISNDGDTVYFYGQQNNIYGVYRLQLSSSDPF